MRPTRQRARLAPEQARAAFLSWARTWRPDLVDALELEMSHRRLGDIDDATGEWSPELSGVFDTLSSWADQFSAGASKVLQTVYEQKMLKAQLERARKGLPPMTTAQAQQVARQGTPAPTGRAINWPLWVGVGGLGLAALFMFAPRARGR